MTIETSSGHSISEAEAIAEMARDGFAAEAKNYGPGSNEPHAHDYDVRLYILEGIFKVTDADTGQVHSFGPGDKASVPAGTRHAEDHGELRMVVGRRHHGREAGVSAQ